MEFNKPTGFDYNNRQDSPPNKRMRPSEITWSASEPARQTHQCFLGMSSAFEASTISGAPSSHQEANFTIEQQDGWDLTTKRRSELTTKMDETIRNYTPEMSNGLYNEIKNDNETNYCVKYLKSREPSSYNTIKEKKFHRNIESIIHSIEYKKDMQLYGDHLNL